MSDPEIEAMATSSPRLDRLGDDNDARVRVLRWAADRYGVQVAPAEPMKPSAGMLDGLAEDMPPRSADAREAAEPTFGQFVDLFDAVDPRSGRRQGTDRCLLASGRL